MSECLITRHGGCGVPASVTYPIVAILTESGTWKVPESGTYRVTAIGCGGNAAFGGHITPYIGYGGAGGIAESTLKLGKNESVTITVSESVTSFGAYLTASGGQDASFDINSAYSGLGGSATGGNSGNYPGGNGGINSRGGDTSAESIFGGAIGGVAAGFYYSRTFAALATTVEVWFYCANSSGKKTSNGFQGYGAGSGYYKAGEMFGYENCMTTKVLNGAIIIERIK